MRIGENGRRSLKSRNPLSSIDIVLVREDEHEVAELLESEAFTVAARACRQLFDEVGSPRNQPSNAKIRALPLAVCGFACGVRPWTPLTRRAIVISEEAGRNVYDPYRRVKKNSSVVCSMRARIWQVIVASRSKASGTHAFMSREQYWCFGYGGVLPPDLRQREERMGRNMEQSEDVSVV